MRQDPRAVVLQKLRARAAVTKQELALAYNISQRTLRRRLHQIPGYDQNNRAKLLLPGDIELIFSVMGDPF